jgi:hypothetical protein
VTAVFDNIRQDYRAHGRNWGAQGIWTKASGPVLAAIVAVNLAGCATPKTLVPIEANRGDGMITLAYEYGAFQNPKVDFAEGVNTAIAKCVEWGYVDVRRISNLETECIRGDVFGPCTIYRDKVTYQCTRIPQPN